LELAINKDENNEAWKEQLNMQMAKFSKSMQDTKDALMIEITKTENALSTEGNKRILDQLDLERLRAKVDSMSEQLVEGMCRSAVACQEVAKRCEQIATEQENQHNVLRKRCDDLELAINKGGNKEGLKEQLNMQMAKFSESIKDTKDTLMMEITKKENALSTEGTKRILDQLDWERLRAKVDSMSEQLVEDMCRSAVESQHVLALKRAILFGQRTSTVNSLEYAKATELYHNLMINADATRDFFGSNYKKVYDPHSSEQRRALKNPGKLPRTGEQVLRIVHQFLTVRSRTASKGWSPSDINRCVDGLRAACQSAIQFFAGGIATARDWVSLIWTTTDLTCGILPCSGIQREFCFIVNEAHRDDDEHALRALLPFILLMNSTLVTRGDPTRNLNWPLDLSGQPVRESFRGTGIPTSRLAWFKQLGRRFRVPFNVASGLEKATAILFAERSISSDESKTAVIFTIRFSRYIDTPAACLHVSLMNRSVAPTELEFLFSAYSVFTITDFEECRGVDFPNQQWLRVELEAAEDNHVDEHLPCVLWF